MELYYNFYDSFIASFPGPTQWMASLIILGALGVTLYVLFKMHWIFLLISPVILLLMSLAARDVLLSLNNGLLSIFN